MKGFAKVVVFSVVLCLVLATGVFAQYPIMDSVRAEVDFSKKLRDWDGFGVNYVEVAQTKDYWADPQEYGGFSLLDESERQEILDMIFGDDGLKPGLVKMFYDPFHQKKPDAEFDHETMTKWMRYFVREGLKRTRARGDDLVIITTLYGPPPWATKQKFMRGRDLDPEMKDALARYMADWVKYLRDEEGFPVKYVSLHNEGEDWMRWPADGKSGNIGGGHDYNMFWPPEQVTKFIPILRRVLDEMGLHDVGVTPGECSNWYRFSEWGYADAIAEDEEALANLGIITSHGFYGPNYGRWYGDHTSTGIDILRAKRPELHAWVTSTSWAKMDVLFVREAFGNIYSAKVNAVIPWACIQRPTKWVGGDPNPGCAFRVLENGTYEVMRGYYYYKQLCRAGGPGMAVAETMAMDSQIAIIAFAQNDSKNPDTFVVINIGKEGVKKLHIKISGTDAMKFKAYRTTDKEEQYKDIGEYVVQDGVLVYEAPRLSVTTFVAE